MYGLTEVFASVVDTNRASMICCDFFLVIESIHLFKCKMYTFIDLNNKQKISTRSKRKMNFIRKTRLNERLDCVDVFIESIIQTIGDEEDMDTCDWTDVLEQLREIEDDIIQTDWGEARDETCWLFFHRIESMYVTIGQTPSYRILSILQSTVNEQKQCNPQPPPLFRDVRDVTKRTTKCSLCSETIVSVFLLTYLGCKHRFHPSCIRVWSNHHTTCPICEHDMFTL